ERLDDIGALRIREMDEAGVDLQVLSHGAPSVQKLDPESAVAISRRANDRLNEACRANPTRLSAFCVCPTPDPKGAADELERAQALGVPIYLHPGYPHKAVVEAYYKEYIGDYPIFATAGWGFGVETATQGIRLVLSGVF